MFKHRRVRVVSVLLGSWVMLAVVERWVEGASWLTAVPAGLLWSSIVAGVWWFAEWTQAGRMRGSADARSRRRRGAGV